MSRTEDVRVEYLGTVCVFQPLGPCGWEWLRESLTIEAWQIIGGGIAVESRMVSKIIDAMTDDGLSVEQ